MCLFAACEDIGLCSSMFRIFRKYSGDFLFRGLFIPGVSTAVLRCYDSSTELEKDGDGSSMIDLIHSTGHNHSARDFNCLLQILETFRRNLSTTALVWFYEGSPEKTGRKIFFRR